MAPIKGSDYDPKLIEPGSSEGHTPDWAKKALDEIHALPETKDDGADEKPKKDLDGDELDKQESGVDTDSGQDAAETPKEESSDAIDDDDEDEDGLYSGSGSDDSKATGLKGRISQISAVAQGKFTKKRGAMALGIGGPLVGLVFLVITLMPSMILNNLRNFLLERVGQLQTSQSLRYRRSKIARISDAFSADGRRGSKIIAEMEADGYRFNFDPNDRNRLLGVTLGDRSFPAANFPDHLSDYMEIKHPLRTARWKTKYTNSFYKRYGISRKSIVAVTDEAIENATQRFNAEFADRTLTDTEVDERFQAGTSDEDLTEEEQEARRQSQQQMIDDLSDSEDAADIRRAEILKGIPAAESELGQELAESLDDISKNITEDALKLAEEAAKNGSFGGKAFSAAKSFFNPTDILDRVCTLKNRIKQGIMVGRNVRSLVLLRYMATFAGIGDGVRKGNVDPKLVNEAGKRLMAVDRNGNPLGASPGFAAIAKGIFSRSKNDASKSAYGVDGKLTGPMAAVQAGTDQIPGTSNSQCVVIQNPIFQISSGVLLTVGKAALCVVTLGFGCAGTQAVESGAKIAVTQAIKIAIQNSLRNLISKQLILSLVKTAVIELSFEGIMTLTQMYIEGMLKTPVTGQEIGQMAGDPMFAGAGVGNKQRSLQAGLVPATEEQYVAAERQYLAEKKENFKKLSLFDRYLSLEQDSLGFALATNTMMSAPTGTSGLANVPQYAMRMFGDALSFGSAKRVTSTLTGSAYAQTQSDPDLITHETYTIERGEKEGTQLATDFAGNLQPIMRSDIEAIDPDENIVYLTGTAEGGPHIDADTLEPTSDVFKKHIENCVNTIDTLSMIEFENDSSDPANDCLADNPLTVRFKAHLAYLDMLDQLDAEFFPDEIATNDGDSAGQGGAGNTGQRIADFNGPVIPCQGQPRAIERIGDRASWNGIAPTGTIGTNSAGQPMNVYIRDACSGQTNVRTVVIGASIHGSENGGQVVAQELLFNKVLPPDVRIIAIPEINGAGVSGLSSRPRLNMNDVNLNRNFDYEWDLASPSSIDPPATYKGTGPASEPETQAIQGFLTNLGRTSLVISYHDNINWVAPSGPNSNVSRPMAQRYATLAGHPFLNNNRGFGFFESWYAATTSTPALLVELSTNHSPEYLERHADAVVGLLTEGLVQ